MPKAHLLQIPNLTLGVDIILQDLKNLLLGTSTRNHSTSQELQLLALLRDIFKNCTCLSSTPFLPTPFHIHPNLDGREMLTTHLPKPILLVRC